MIKEIADVGYRIVVQLVKLRAGWIPALQAGYQPAAGCQPAPPPLLHDRDILLGRGLLATRS